MYYKIYKMIFWGKIEIFFNKVTQFIKFNSGVFWGIGVTIFILFTSYKVYDFSRERAYSVAKYYTEGGRKTTDWIDSVQVSYSNLPKSVKVLQLYNKIIRQRKTFHKSVALNLMTFNVAIIMAQILSISILFVILATITSVGWANVNKNYKSVFIVVSVISASAYLFSSSYKIEQNIYSNLNQYSVYDKIQIELVQDLSDMCDKSEFNLKSSDNLNFKIQLNTICKKTNQKISDATKIELATDFGVIKLNSLNGILKE